MQIGQHLESTMRTMLSHADPYGMIAKMASVHQDKYHAVDMWIHACPVQLTTITPYSQYGTLLSKVRNALLAMPHYHTRYILCVDPYCAGNHLLLKKVVAKLARTTTPVGDKVVYLDPCGEIHYYAPQEIA